MASKKQLAKHNKEHVGKAVDFKSHGKSVKHEKPGLLKRVGTPITVTAAVLQHAQLTKRVAALSKAPKSSSGSGGWTLLGTDTKAEDPAAGALQELKEFTAFARGAITESMGGKSVPLTLPLTLNFSAPTAGLVASVLSVAVSDSPEWASCAALFDEYRFLSGVMNYAVVAPTSTVVLGTSTLTNNANLATGYDPADATVPTDVRDICQLEQHVQLFPRIVPTNTTGTYVGVYGRQDNKPHVMKFDVTRYGLTTSSNTGTGTLSVGAWKATNLSPLGDGSIKMYYQSGQTASAVVVVTGVLYYHILLRSRT